MSTATVVAAAAAERRTAAAPEGASEVEPPCLERRPRPARRWSAAPRDTARTAGAPLVVRSVQERFARAEERRRRSALPAVAPAADWSSAVTGTRRPVGDYVARVLPASDDRRRNRREPEALERMSAARTSVERTAVAQHSRRSGRLRSSASR